MYTFVVSLFLQHVQRGGLVSPTPIDHSGIPLNVLLRSTSQKGLVMRILSIDKARALDNHLPWSQHDALYVPVVVFTLNIQDPNIPFMIFRPGDTLDAVCDLHFPPFQTL